jgi:hypothetical protein
VTDYIEVPIETNPDTLAQEGFDYLETQIPGWIPNDGNLETILIEALSRMVAEARDVASAVPTDIFRYYGELVDILPQDATFAQSTVAFTVIDSQGYTIPLGTQIGIRVSGDELVPFETASEAVIAPGFTSYTGVPIQAIEAGAAASGLAATLGAELIDTLDFVTLVDLESTTSGGEDAEDTDTYLGRLVERLQMLAPRPILAKDFALFAQDIPEVDRATAVDGYNPVYNVLSVNQASIETDTTGWTADTNTTIARDTAQFLDGMASLRLRSTAAGDISAYTSMPFFTGIIPGERWTAIASFRPSVARTVRLLIHWYTVGESFLSSVTVDQALSAGVWQQVVASGDAPATAAKAQVYARVLSTAAGNEDHWMDNIALRRGTDTTWAPGGTGANELNQERTVAVAVMDANGNPLSAALRQVVDDYLESLREVNFIVNVTSAVYTPIDVTFTAVALSGFDPETVEEQAEQAVIDYLSPKNWGLPDPESFGDLTTGSQWVNKATVRYLELAQVINNVGGVDYISALTFRKGINAFATTDVSLGGMIPLPQPGTITGTVT